MATLAGRDDDALARGFATWCAHRWPSHDHEVVELARPTSGWSNEMLLITVRSSRRGSERRDRFVIRLPPPLPTYPHYDLSAQARVMEAVAARGVPVPRVVALEGEDRWLGAPFLVMSRVPGRPGPEVPALDPWVADAPFERQWHVQNAFVSALATIHRVDWRDAGLHEVLRGDGASLASEVGWWQDYVAWAADGAPTVGLADALAWCRETAPSAPPATLCWGDARLGNLIFDDDASVAAVLDWELASIGPPELDLAWYLTLDDLTTHFTRRSVPGFLPRGELVERYQQLLGREVADLGWHEIFALSRSIAINERQARLAAIAEVPYPGIAGDANPVLRLLASRIARF